MADVNECFSNFAAEMRRATYQELIKTDLEYQELECYVDRYKDKFNQIINSLDEKDKVFMENYITTKLERDSCINESLYIAGYTDCIKLLKELTIL